ncbi:MAG TPA: hypothetical protein VLU25_05735 [Acidobacteriota bacterium]|nr:hypothetical protein [Acidobacteriota bacterium]
MEGYDRRTSGNVQLKSVYVPLTVSGMQNREEVVKLRSRRLRLAHALLLDLVAKQNLAVSGATGSGKSRFCRWVAIRAAGGPAMAQPVAPPEEFVETWPKELKGRLPLLVPLRDFWGELPSKKAELSRGELEAALQSWVASKKPDGLSWDDVEAHLKEGSAMMIFDGFDEVPPSDKRNGREWSPKELLLSGLRDAVEEGP